MRDSFATVFDVVAAVFMIAISLPGFLFIFHFFLSGPDFGFQTLHDKSVMATPAQERDLFQDQYLQDKKLLTNAHILMLPLADDRQGANQKISVVSEGGASKSYSYDVSYQEKQNAEKQILDAVNWYYTLGETSSYSTYKYHISIDSYGSITLSPERKEVM